MNTAISTPVVSQVETTILTFPLDDILPDKSGKLTLVANSTLGTLLLLDARSPDALVTHEIILSPVEFCLLHALLEHIGEGYCPIEVLLASVAGGEITEQDVTRARKRLHKALEGGTWSTVTGPVRNILSRVRLKLQTFRFSFEGQEHWLNIYTIIMLGYMLKAEKSR